MNTKLDIAWLYPDLMSTYGDRGNLMILERRSLMRGIDIQVHHITLETPVEILKKCDLIFMGGAQDRQQQIVGNDFLKVKGPVVKQMVEKYTPALFVCAAYQFAGYFYRPYRGKDILGAGILDLYTIHPGDQAKRLIGNIAGEIIFNSQFSILNEWKTIVGFENHGGRTYLGSNVKPFARVLKGFGNNGEDGYEGAVYKNTIGSYFHGPILPKNPHIADWLIARALEIKYGKDIELEPLDDKLEWQAHKFILTKLGINK